MHDPSHEHVYLALDGCFLRLHRCASSPALKAGRQHVSEPRLPMHTCHVYILASIAKTLLLRRRVYQHKTGMIPGFTSQYGVNRLVHDEAFSDIHDARGREKRLKGWVRKKKIDLIESQNPEWEDLADRIGLPLSATAGTGE